MFGRLYSPALLLTLVVSLALAGCHHSAGPGDGSAPAVGDLPPTLTPMIDNPVPPALWPQAVFAAASLIHKNKAEVVKKLGPPTETKPLFGSLSYEYEYPDYHLSLFFNDIGPPSSFLENEGRDTGKEKRRFVEAAAVQLKHVSFTDAKTAWHQIGGRGPRPSDLLLSSADLDDYLDAPEIFKDHEGRLLGFPVRLEGQVQNGTRVILEGGSPEAPLTRGEKQFDTNKNEYVYGKPLDNALFSWSLVTVQTIYVSQAMDRGLGLHTFNTRIALKP